MSLVVETGAGLVDANSYVSVEYADSYVTDYAKDGTAWAAANTAAKEKALKQATQYIDLKFGNKFTGTKSKSTQALSWPRYRVYDIDGYLVASNFIHRYVQQATVEAALRVIAGDDLLAVQAAGGNIASETKKIGSLEKSTAYVGGKNQVPIYSKIEALLRPFVASRNVLHRG